MYLGHQSFNSVIVQVEIRYVKVLGRKSRVSQKLMRVKGYNRTGRFWNHSEGEKNNKGRKKKG